MWKTEAMREFSQVIKKPRILKSRLCQLPVKSTSLDAGARKRYRSAVVAADLDRWRLERGHVSRHSVTRWRPRIRNVLLALFHRSRPLRKLYPFIRLHLPPPVLVYRCYTDGSHHSVNYSNTGGMVLRPLKIRNGRCQENASLDIAIFSVICPPKYDVIFVLFDVNKWFAIWLSVYKMHYLY